MLNFEGLKNENIINHYCCNFLATSTAVSADWDMPFFGDNDNSKLQQL